MQPIIHKIKSNQTHKPIHKLEKTDIKNPLKVPKEETKLPNAEGVVRSLNGEISDAIGGLKPPPMPDSVPGSELAQVHSVVRRKSSLEGEGGRKTAQNHGRRHQNGSGDENPGGKAHCGGNN